MPRPVLVVPLLLPLLPLELVTASRARGVTDPPFEEARLPALLRRDLRLPPLRLLLLLRGRVGRPDAGGVGAFLVVDLVRSERLWRLFWIMAAPNSM